MKSMKVAVALAGLLAAAWAAPVTAAPAVVVTKTVALRGAPTKSAIKLPPGCVVVSACQRNGQGNASGC